MDRLDFSGDLNDVFKQVADTFKLGELQSHSLIPVGYEDVNFMLHTSIGKYFVKIFAKTKVQSDIDRYAGNIEAALAAGVPHPTLNKQESGEALFRVSDTKLQLLVMEWVKGKSFWDERRQPTTAEAKEVIQIAAKINGSSHKPTATYDSWAANNIENEFNQYGRTLIGDDKQLVGEVVDDFKKLHIDLLPHCFVHGDLIATNVLVSDAGLYVVDFSVASYYPRIQELAVLFCNLLFDENNEVNSKQLYDDSIQQYRKTIELAEEEVSALGTYTRAAHAMHIIGASKAITRNEDDDENQYWLKLGRTGLSMNIY